MSMYGQWREGYNHFNFQYALFGDFQRLSKSCQILDSLVVQLIGCHELNRTVSVQGNQVIKVAHNGRLWGGRNILFYILIKSSPEIPRFVNIKIQVEVEVEVDCELGDIFFLALPPPKVDHSLQLLSLKQLERTSSWVSKTRIWHKETNRVNQNLASKIGGIFKWQFFAKVKAEKKNGSALPPLNRPFWTTLQTCALLKNSTLVLSQQNLALMETNRLLPGTQGILTRKPEST